MLPYVSRYMPFFSQVALGTFLLALPFSRSVVVLSSLLLVFTQLPQIKRLNKTDVRTKILFGLCGLYIFYSLLSLLWSPDPSFGWDLLKRHARFLLIIPFYLAIKQESHTKHLHLFLISLSAFLILHETQTLHFIKNVSPTDPANTFLVLDQIDYSIFAAIASLICLVKTICKTTNHNMWRFFHFFLFCFFMYFLCKSMGRTGYLTFVGVCTVLILASRISFKKTLLLFTGLGLFCFLVFSQSPYVKHILLYSAQSIEKSLTKNDFRSSLGMRVFFAQAIFQKSYHTYLSGSGLGSGKQVIKNYAKKVSLTHASTHQFGTLHSTYLDTFSDLGLIGLTLLLGIIIYLYRLVITSKLFYIRAISVLGPASFFFSSIGDSLLIRSYSFHLIIFLMALSLKLSSSSNVKNYT